MFSTKQNSVITLAILLTFVGVSKPAKAFLLAQSETAPATFSLPDELPQNAKVQIAASDSTSSFNESLKESFSSKYPEAQVNIEAQDSSSALRSLSEGKADLVSIGRPLSPEEKAQGFIEVPISREKIAIVVSPNNSYDGSLTIEQFAQIFRGEITDWSELGGIPGKIYLVDLPDSNDTRQAFLSYPVFQSAEFSTGSNTVKLEEDSTDAMIAQLGESGIGYAVANDVIGRNDVKIVTMDQTQPNNPRYPFSQPFYLVYKETPSEGAQAYLGFATTEGVQQAVAERVGSVQATTGGFGFIGSLTDDNADTSTAPQADADTDEETAEEEVVPDADTDVETAEEEVVPDADTDVETAEEEVVADADTDVETSEEEVVADADTDVETAEEEVVADAETDEETAEEEVVADAETDEETAEEEVVADADTDVETAEEEVVADADTNGGGDVENSRDINPDVEDSGEIKFDVEDSSKSLSSDNPEIDETTTPDTAIANKEETNPSTTEGNTSGVETTATKGGWGWLMTLILGISLSVLGAMLAFGGRKKSDQEPAISNISNISNIPNITNIPNSDVHNVDISVSGEAEVAGVAASQANLVESKQSVEDNIDFDRVELEAEPSKINLTNQLDNEINDRILPIPSKPEAVTAVYWKTGQKLNNGKYVVNNILGSGGFGVTYKITEAKTDKLFALKTLNIEARSRADFKQLQTKFINEAIALASCPHPNIVRVYPQVFQEGELWCMVMEYVEGEDLGRYIEKNGKFSESKAIIIITKVGEALSSIHQKGFLHRDIKPANILLRSADLSPVLIDFGLAREFISEQSLSMTNSRTESFAPIEQYQRRGNFGAWTDVYALAATLYVLLTARPPLPAKFRYETDYKLTPPQQYEPQISDRINEAILKGMEIEPSDRSQSVAEWLKLFN